MDTLDKVESYKYIFWSKEFLLQKNIIANLAAISYQELIDQLNELDNKVNFGSVEFSELVRLW